VAAGSHASPRTNRPLLGSSGLLRGGLSRSSSTLLDVGCGPGLCPGRHDRASPGSCEPGHAPLKPIPSSVPRVLSPVRSFDRTSSHEVPGPCDDFTRASPMGCGPSVPAAVPPVGFLTPRAVSRQARAGGDVSRRCRPGPSPFRAFPSRAARSPLSGPLRPSPLVTGAPGATSVPWIPRVSPTPTSLEPR
jgi:hypothetical protein